MEWSGVDEQYFSDGIILVGGVIIDSLPGCDLQDPHADFYGNFKIDGQSCGPSENFGSLIPYGFYNVGCALSEGWHTAAITFNVHNRGCGDIPDIPYSFNHAFFVDKTDPEITFTHPENNVAVSTADLAISGNVTDTASKVGSVDISVGADRCWFKRDFDGNVVYLYSIRKTFTSNGDFPIAYDLRDYVDLSSGQDCTFSVVVNAKDRVGNNTDMPSKPAHNISFTVDQAPPVVAITSPTADGAMYGDLQWGDLDSPVISGTTDDLSDISQIWLVIKDEKAKRWWNGYAWQGVEAKANVTERSETKPVNWKYTGLTREAMRSGTFMITAYAKDKHGHVGVNYRRGGYKKHYPLGEKDFVRYQLTIKDVKNRNRTEGENPYSFTTKTGEGIIDVAAEFTPATLGPILNRYVEWTVLGVEPPMGPTISGTPNKPPAGSPSVFYIRPPQVPTRALGRTYSMGYEVSTKVNYNQRIYENPEKMGIYQDEIDKCRQEYVDFRVGVPTYGGLYVPNRGLNGNDFSTSGQSAEGLFLFYSTDKFRKLNWGDYSFGIVKQQLYAGLENLRTSIRAVEGLENRGIAVVSGYRNPKHNYLPDPDKPTIHGARNSRHQWGDAADVAIVDMDDDGDVTVDDWQNMADIACASPVNATYVETYRQSSTHLHLDFGPIRGTADNNYCIGGIP